MLVYGLCILSKLYCIISVGTLPELLYCCVNSFVWFSQVLVQV